MAVSAANGRTSLRLPAVRAAPRRDPRCSGAHTATAHTATAHFQVNEASRENPGLLVLCVPIDWATV
jgi:hypothetical protein